MDDTRGRTAAALVILAGGRGSRYGGAKQFAPVGPAGEPLAAYALYDAARAGFARAIVVCPPGAAPRLTAELAPRAPTSLALAAVEQPPASLQVHGSEERTRPGGTAHAVLAARDAIGTGAFAVANADDFYGAGAFAALAAFLAGDADGAHALVAYRLERTMGLTRGVSRAVCGVRDGLLIGVTERRDVRPAPLEGPSAMEAPSSPDRPTSDPGSARFLGTTPEGAVEPIPGDARVSMNLWGFRPGMLDDLARLWEEFRAGDPGPDGEFALPGAVDRLVREGARVRVLDTDEEAFGLTTRADLPRVREAIARRVAAGAYPPDLRAG